MANAIIADEDVTICMRWKQMDDLISRQDAIDAVLDINAEHRVSWKDTVIDIIDKLPSAQLETHEKRTETHACDCISRQAVIERVDRIIEVNYLRPDLVWFTPNGVKALLEELPSAQSEIIKCKDCIHRYKKINIPMCDFVDFCPTDSSYCSLGEK